MPPVLRLRKRAPADGPRVAPSWLLGAPLRLPGAADRIAEGWWRLSPRMRLTLGGVGAAAMIAAVTARIALSPYGAPTVVVIATSDLMTGVVLSNADVTTARWPGALVPTDAVVAGRDAIGARLTMGVTAGTVLTDRHLRRGGPLADLGAGMAAVPVPSQLLRGVSARARLDLVATAADGSGRALARDVLVLAADGETVWLQVERERAPDVAAAAARGTLSGAVLAQ